MPGGDRTGPAGRGPMTGWGTGVCAGYGATGFTNRGYGAGGAFVSGRGGRGRRNRFFATGVPGRRYFDGNSISGGWPFSAQPEIPEDELDLLKGQARHLENGLKKLQSRMEALTSGNKTD